VCACALDLLLLPSISLTLSLTPLVFPFPSTTSPDGRPLARASMKAARAASAARLAASRASLPSALRLTTPSDPTEQAERARFMAAMLPQSVRTQVWANDDSALSLTQHTNTGGVKRHRDDSDGVDAQHDGIMGESLAKRVKKDDDVVGDSARAYDAGRLFVRNLPFTSTEEDVAAYFGAWGSVAEVHVPSGSNGDLSTGIAFVQFAHADDAVRAAAEADGKSFQGRLLHVMGARPREEDGRGERERETGGYKSQHNARRRQEAAAGHNWSTFYMRPDTIASAIAHRYAVSKDAVVGREATDAAVNVALGEAAVLQTTVDELQAGGVNVEALKALARASAEERMSVRRSKKVILVKNMPFEAEEAALRELFARHGALTRVVLPSTRALGIVAFERGNSAKAAFRSLAYSNVRPRFCVCILRI
jgi:multiple RNA-binding domain-containing protein 1